MLTHRTNVLLSEEEHFWLEMTAQKRNMSKGAVIREALTKFLPQSKDDSRLKSRREVLNTIKKMRSFWNLDNTTLDWKELRDHGRKY